MYKKQPCRKPPNNGWESRFLASVGAPIAGRLLGLSPESVDASTTRDVMLRGDRKEVREVNSFVELRERWGEDVVDDRTRNERSTKREKWGHVEVKVI